MSVKALLEQAYSQVVEEVPKQGIFASETGHCPRFRYFRYHQVPYSDPPTPVAIMELGELIERLVLEKLVAADPEWQTQVEVKHPLGVSGRCDAYHPSHRILLELKTVSANALPYLPQKSHLLQLALYADCPDIQPQTAVLLYLFRENPDPTLAREFIYDCDSNEFQVLKETAVLITQQLLEDLAKDEPPPVSFAPDQFPCSWETETAGKVYRCPFFSRCHGPLATDVPKPPVTVDVTQLLTLYEHRQMLKSMLNQTDQRLKTLLTHFVETLPSDADRVALSNDYVLVKVTRRSFLQQKALSALKSMNLPLDEFFKTTTYYRIVPASWKERIHKEEGGESHEGREEAE